MTKDELRAAAARLSHLHERVAPLFGRSEAREHAMDYVNGLLLGEGRKSVEPLALSFGQRQSDNEPASSRVLAMQRFLTDSPWDADAVQGEIQAIFAEQIAPSATGNRLGVVGVIDGSTFPKKGTESVGVSRQYCGRLGKVDNCQAGVFVVGVAPAGTVMLDQQLYLPKVWVKDQDRRQKTRVPKKQRFQTKLR